MRLFTYEITFEQYNKQGLMRSPKARRILTKVIAYLYKNHSVPAYRNASQSAHSIIIVFLLFVHGSSMNFLNRLIPSYELNMKGMMY